MILATSWKFWKCVFWAGLHFLWGAGQAKKNEKADKNLATYGLTKSYISEQLLNAGFDMKSYTFDTYVKGPNQVIECEIACASAPSLCVCVCVLARTRIIHCILLSALP
jgi:hypothetical protein